MAKCKRCGLKTVLSEDDIQKMVEQVTSMKSVRLVSSNVSVSYTHLRAHETDSYLVCRLLLEKKKKKSKKKEKEKSQRKVGDGKKYNT